MIEPEKVGQKVPYCVEYNNLVCASDTCSKAYTKNRYGVEGCRFVHRCNFRFEEGEPCNLPPPCRAMAHYLDDWDRLGRPPHYYDKPTFLRRQDWIDRAASVPP